VGVHRRWDLWGPEGLRVSEEGEGDPNQINKHQTPQALCSGSGAFSTAVVMTHREARNAQEPRLPPLHEGPREGDALLDRDKAYKGWALNVILLSPESP